MMTTMMTTTQSRPNLYEVKYVNKCHIANRKFASKLTPVYLVADNFLDAVESAHQNKHEDYNVFSVTLEQQNITLIK